MRRMMTFMVTNGFSLLEVRKLFIDELFEFYKQIIYILEKRGEFKEGTFDKLNGHTDSKTVVNQLRASLSKLKK